MRISFGIGLPCEHPDDFLRQVRLAEEAGFEIVATGDSPAIHRDPFVGLAMAAVNTKRCKLATFVTNPLTRHPVVTASAIATVDELSHGRAILGIGTGYSGVQNLGLKPASSSALAEYICALRDLWSKSQATYRNTTIRMVWARKPVPIYVASSGPKTLRVAGRLADGVFIGTGLFPELIEESLAELRAGAREAGRRLEEIDLWWFIKANLGPSREAAAEGVRSGLASSAGLTFSTTLEGKHLPREMLPFVERLKRGYDFTRHVGTEARNPNAELVDDPIFLDYLARRFGIVGTPQDWIDTIRQLEKHGVRKLIIAGVMPDKEGFITTLGREVIEACRR